MANKNSFEQYIKDTFCDEICNALNKYVEDNSVQFDFAPSWMCRVDESGVEDFYITHVNVENKEDMCIAFYPTVRATLFVTGRGKYDVETEEKDFYFRLKCTGDLAKELKDFSVEFIEEYNGKRQMQGAMTDRLVPFIKSENLDKYATDILEKYYPEALEQPMRVDAYVLAKRMGLSVHNCSITQDGSVFGRIYFYDCVGEIYDKEKSESKKGKIRAKTILVDTDALFLHSMSDGNITIAHECVHYALHKKAFEFKKLSCPQITQIQCQITGDAYGFSDERETSWMEYHANEIAPRLLMPYATFKLKSEEVIRDCFRRNNTTELVDVIEEVIDTLADFYKVPRAVDQEWSMLDMKRLSVLLHILTDAILSRIKHQKNSNLTEKRHSASAIKM
jgi:hypothetical protein